MNRIIQSALTALAIAGVVSLNVSDSIGQESPSQAVKALYMAANEGRYSEADKYLSSDLKEFEDSILELTDAPDWVRQYRWVALTRDGTVKEIEILKEDVRGQYALVDWIVHFEDGETEEMTEIFVKEGGQWKMDLTVEVE